MPDSIVEYGRPNGRWPETTAETIARAHRLICRHGFTGDGFGDTNGGYSLEGAVYAAHGLLESFCTLHDAPTPVYAQCDDAFCLIAAALGQPGLKPGKALAAVMGASIAWGDDGQQQAMRLLETVFCELTDVRQAAA